MFWGIKYRCKYTCKQSNAFFGSTFRKDGNPVGRADLHAFKVIAYSPLNLSSVFFHIKK